MADSIARTLSQSGVCVVSGFAFGIDRAAHWGAVRGVGSTIAVLGTGIDLIYPFSNRDLWTEIADKGLIISEFAPGTKPEGINFPHRNRIVSGLSLGVLVVEGALKSGSLITAELALAQNRDVLPCQALRTSKHFRVATSLFVKAHISFRTAMIFCESLRPDCVPVPMQRLSQTSGMCRQNQTWMILISESCLPCCVQKRACILTKWPGHWTGLQNR